MHINKILCLLIALLSITGSLAEEISGLTLSDQQLQSLKKAREDDYLVRVLSSQVAGVDRNIVILGEVHVKRDSADKAGREVLSQFSLRGLEGIMVEGSLTRYALIPIGATIKLMHNAASLLTWRRKASTIHTSKVQDSHREVITVFPESTATADIVNVLLEAGAGDYATIIGTVHIPLLLLNPILRSLPILRDSTFINLISIYTTVQGLHLMYKGLTYLVNGEISPTLSPYVFPFVYFLLDHRNHVMVNNALNVLSTRLNEQNILIIVGKFHVGGMARLLRENHGFEDISNELFPE